MSHVLDDLELHATGALPPERSAQVAAHLEGCASCRAAADEIAEIVGLLPEAVPPREPPAALRDRILAAARADLEREARPGILAWLRPRLGTLAVAATIALLVGVDANAMIRLERTQAELARYAGDLERVSHAERAWYMAGVDAWDGMGGTLIVQSNDRRPFVLFHDLRPLPDGRTYALWLIAPDGSWARGTSFGSDGNRYQLVDVGLELAGFEHCAVTVETGPSGKREGPLVMRSRIAPPGG